MKKLDFATLTTDELIDRFVEIGIAQCEALKDEKIDSYNRLFDQMNLVDEQLRIRGPSARQALLRLYDHPNIQVRLKAAQRSFGVARDKARAALAEIAESKQYPQAADASLSVRKIDDGTTLLT